MAGPFTKTWGNTSKSFYKTQTWSTQAKPYLKPLPYKLIVAQTTRGSWGCGAHWINHDTISWTNALNRLAEKLNAQIGQKAQLSVTLLERKQAVSMIRNRATQLVTAVRKLRKGQFGAAARVLGITKPRSVSRHKQFANNWLEYSFGWKPLVQDIGSAVEILQSPIANMRCRASTTSTYVYTSGGYPGIPKPGMGANYQDRIGAKLRAGCDVVSVNPDLWLANQMGFVNPLTVLWEMIPFSFIVDWFASVGSFLEGMTARIGVKLANEFTTIYSIGSSDHIGRNLNGSALYDTGKWHQVGRSLGLPSIKPNIRPFVGFSVTRGLNAISVLLQLLRK